MTNDSQHKGLNTCKQTVIEIKIRITNYRYGKQIWQNLSLFFMTIFDNNSIFAAYSQ